MAKVSKVKRKSDSRRHKVSPYPSPSSSKRVHEGVCKKKCCKASEKKDWDDATCSVCMEFPHNAVLLLCSSYDKGCRPYMCATSDRYSNCLDQYKKAYTKIISTQSVLQGSIEESSSSMASGQLVEKTEVTELLCPLCRGQVKGWTVVEPAREYLNAKKRTCMQEKCSFVGSYKQLRKHVKAEHPLARPRQVDPTLEAKWKRLENERERNDVISTIRSSTPGAIVLGDYVIEGNYRGFHRNFDDLDAYLGDVFRPFGSVRTGDLHLHPSSQMGFRLLDEDDDSELFRLASSSGRSLTYGRSYGRSGRRRRHRMASGDQ